MAAQENRLTRRRVNVPVDWTIPVEDQEVEALRRLWVAGLHTQEAVDEHPAKLATLVDTLRSIGFGPRSSTRTVISSERNLTLNWIAEAVRDQLGMSEVQVQTFDHPWTTSSPVPTSATSSPRRLGTQRPEGRLGVISQQQKPSAVNGQAGYARLGN